MSYLNTKYNKKEKTTTFTLSNGIPADISLETKLSKQDFNVIVAIVERAYHAGFNNGGEERAKEIRLALGIE